MKNKIIKIISVINVAVFVVVFSAENALFAATTTSPAGGEKMLEEMINAESARVAELNVKLNPMLGINHTLQKRSTGNDVRLLQQFLKVYGVYPEGLITGYFGLFTERAVKKFQEKESLDSVGIAGPKTRARIVEISQQEIKKNLAISSSALTTALISASTAPTSSAASTTVFSTTSAAPKIINAVLTTDIAENGAAITPVASFASTTQNIYAVLSLNNVAQDTEIAYIRYYGTAYVDSEVSHPSRSNLRYFHFQWSLKSNNNRLAGKYSIVFYANGKSAKTIQYTIY